MSRKKRILSLTFAAFAVIGLIVLSSKVKEQTDPSWFITQPVIAQSLKSSDISQRVYQKLPDLPLENQYIDRETGKVDPNNTLMSRLVRYHIYVKGRPAIYRLDWKLTLADYLGANDLMLESRYPGSDSLRKNPIDGDRAAINRLNRAQRDALVQVLVSIFNPDYSATSVTAPSAKTQPQATPRPSGKSIPPQP